MNLIFFGIIDLMKDFFNENFSSLGNEIDSNFLIEGWMVFQKSIEEFSGTGGDIASAPVILLAAGVIIFLGVAGEAFFKRTGILKLLF